MSMMKGKARITGMGTYVPERILSNQDLEKMVDTSDEWITTRTGIQERRIASDEESAATMGILAARRALEDAQISTDQVDCILCATLSPDYPVPSTAVLIQEALGMTDIPAFDLAAACTGHLYGLSMAKAYIEAGMYKKILLVSSEKMSSVVDYKDRSTCVLFGDGASACVLSDEGAGYLLGACDLGADGTRAMHLSIPLGGSREPLSKETIGDSRRYLQMEGREVFKHAVRRMIESSEKVLRAEGLGFEDIDWMVPHQANLRIILSIMKRLKVPEDRVYKTAVVRYGNQSAASVAVALDEMLREKDVQEGERIVVCAFGAGFTWGAVLLTKIGEENDG